MLNNLLFTANFSEFYQILLPIALILLTSKLLQLLCKKLNLPIVVGMLLAGVVLALIKLIPGQDIASESAIFNSNILEGLSFLSKIGVVLIMFEAGIGTDMKQIKSCGFASIVITCLGVILPMALGIFVAFLFRGTIGDDFHSWLFYGVILTATSVSVTVAALKELGKLNSKVGTSIVSAAIIDDILGVIILSVIVGLSNAEQGASENPGLDILWVILKTVAFFAIAIIIGFLLRVIFNKLERKHPHTQRIPIFSLAFCFFASYAAEKWFGIADITGAYIAGLILSKLSSKDYIDRRAEQASYMLFSPIFFAMIPISNMFNGSESINPDFILFGVSFIIAGILGKLIGAGVGALMCKYSFKDSYRIGLGMMVRAEVCLVCANKGLENGLVDQNIMIFIIFLILITSFVTPLLLKISYKNEVDDSTKPLDSSSIKQEEIVNQ